MVHTGTCPICGEGRLMDLAFDGSTQDGEGRPEQQPDSRQVTTYSCGHSVVGRTLGEGSEDLDVERRDPVDGSPAAEAVSGAGEEIILDAAERAALVHEVPKDAAPPEPERAEPPESERSEEEGKS